MKKFVKKAITMTLTILMIVGFMMPAMATGHSFSDVREGRWYSKAVQFVYEHDIMGGVGGNRFNPRGQLTRAQVAALLFRVHNERMASADDCRIHPFTDVKDNWATPYIAWAYQNDIVAGTSSTTFNPTRSVTRQEFAVMLYRYAMNMTDLRDGNVFTRQWWDFMDREEVATWAYSALRWMNNRSIVTGSTAATVNPIGTATRAEAAVMMMRFVEVVSLDPALVCLGCGDERFPWGFGADGDFFGIDLVAVELTRCISQRDNRSWTLEDFGDIPGALYLMDFERLPDSTWQLIQAGKWQETIIVWPLFRRVLLIRFDQNSGYNITESMRQLQQNEFVRDVAPAVIGPPNS